MASTWGTSWGTSWATSWDRSPTPPTPPTPTSTDGGGGSGWTRKREDWRRDKPEIRAKLERAMGMLADVPSLAPEVAEIKREHQAPRPKAARKQAPRVDWDSLLADTQAVEWLLREYEKRISDDDDDEEALFALMH